MALAALRPVRFSQRAFLLARSTVAANTAQHRSISLQSYVVTPKELNDALKQNVPTKISTSPRVIPLCASWFMPNDPEGRTGIDTFRKKRIPNARFFDIDGVKDVNSPYPHMLPSKEIFAEAMQSMGIHRDDEVVVYDSEEQGLLSAPRVGWTLKFFGHPNVHVLNNFRMWVREGYPVEEGEVAPNDTSDYVVDSYNPNWVVHFEEMEEMGEDYGKEGSDAVQILDARPAGRWAGTDKEPRAGLSSGHMPGSQSMPFGELLDPETKTLRPPAELRQVFESKGVDPNRPVISTCGSGVTAAVIDLALEQANYVPKENRRLYDGSWTEWASRVTEASGLIRKA
ncbi:thiosulfate sulfurtransferase [Arthroderma uncinatum]|uniref:thiosulfate sulfurtransferase n=1 Tax=Arthroderma uncinatum TaxID=74035 RepID=UPI00144A5D1F|nr:thiosulfate sulfurtransferase [Arthroderma uncinatum]KAF3480597.1 thiosulfate sulfurtransferase [Arthroderma uncinatum]